MMMAKNDNFEKIEALQGEKMIELKVRFWTNDIAPGAGEVVQKHAWTAGVVRMKRNDSHGIVPKKAYPFHSLLDVGAVIEKALIDHGIVLHPNPKMKKYLSLE
jgi:hypothetical protein